MEERDNLLQMLNAARQLQQQVIQQVNQMEMDRQRMANEVVKLQGQIEMLEQMTKEKEEVQDGKIVEFTGHKEDPGGQEG